MGVTTGIGAAVAAGAVLMTAGSASAWEKRAPVGAQWPFDVAFETPPPAATPRPGSSCEAALKYVTLITTDRGSEVPNLFTEDAVFIARQDKVLRGRAQIASFYNHAHQPGATPLSFIDAGDECIMELAGMRTSAIPGHPDQYRLVAIDHFRVRGDGLITGLAIFFRVEPLGLAHLNPE